MEGRLIEDSAFLNDELEMAREERVLNNMSIIEPKNRNYTFDKTCMELFGYNIPY